MGRKTKKQNGGLDENNMPIGTDIGESYISTIPKPEVVKLPASQAARAGSSFTDLSRLESDVSLLQGTRPATYTEAPGAYKTVFNTDTQEFWNALMAKYGEFKVLGTKDKLGKLAVQMAEYSNALESVEQLYNNGDILETEKNSLIEEITAGNLFKKSDKYSPGEQILNKILGLRYDQVTDEDLQNFKLSSYGLGLLDPDDELKTTLDEATSLEDMLAKREEYEQEIQERENSGNWFTQMIGADNAGIKNRTANLGEDYYLRNKISEARGETSAGDIFGTTDYFETQLADDLGGMVSTWEGMAMSIAGTAVPAAIRNFTKTKNPYLTAGLTLAEISTVAYGQYWSRSAETSMEVGEAYEQKVQQLLEEKEEEIKLSGSNRDLTQKEVNDIYIKASDGLDKLRDKNMTLGATDLAQFALTFGRVPGMGNWASNTRLGKLTRHARSTTTAGRIGVNAAKYGLAIGVSRELEGMEEGMQFRWMQDYLGENNVGDAGFFSHATEGVSDAANYFGMVSGLTKKDNLYNTPGFQNAVQSGKDMATVMTGAGRAHRGITDVYRSRLALHALGEEGKNIDQKEINRIKRETILPYIINGKTKYLQDALYRLGSKGVVDGFDKDQAVAAIKEIDQLQNDYNKIFDKKSPIGISIAGFEYDIFKGAQVTPYSMYDRAFVFNNVANIRQDETLLKELEEQREQYLSNKSELGEFFTGDHLTDAQKQALEKKLEDRGINSTPVDVLIEEAKRDIANAKDSNAQIATGEYTYVSAPGMAQGVYKRDDFDTMYQPNKDGKLVGGILKEIQNLKKKQLDSQLQKEGAPAFTEEEASLLKSLQLIKSKLEYEASYEFFGKQRLKDQQRFSKAHAYDTLARLVSIIETKGKEGLKEVLPSILNSNTKMDQQTIEEIADLADKIVSENETNIERIQEIEDSIDTIMNGEDVMSEAEAAEHDRLMKEKDQTGFSTDPARLEELRAKKERDRKVGEMKEEQQALTEAVQSGAQTSVQAQNLLNRLAKDNTEHLLDDDMFRSRDESETILDLAVDNIANELAKIAAEVQDNPEYSNLNRIDSLIKELEDRIAIFDLRSKDTEVQSEKDLYNRVEAALTALLPQAQQLRALIETNAISRTTSQIELENDVVAQMLSPLGMNTSFEFVNDGLKSLIDKVIDAKYIELVQGAVQSGLLTDKIVAAQILLDLFKVGLEEQPSLKRELVEDLKKQESAGILRVENIYRGMAKAGGKRYLSNPADNFPTAYFNFLRDDLKDSNNAYYKYQDHLNESKLLRDITQQGIMPEMQQLLEAHLDVKAVTYFLRELDSEPIVATNIINELSLVENERITFLPSKQQINAVREIVSFMLTPMSKLGKGKKGLGSISALLQGAAGTGKTNVVLKMAIQMSGLANNQIYAFGHNESSSKTLNNSLGLPTNTLDKFLSDDTVIYDEVKLVVIDEAPGIPTDTLLQIEAKIEAINKERESADKIKVILAGDPAQITPDGNPRPLAPSLIEYNLAKVITPVTSLYRSDNPAIIDFQDSFRRRTDSPLDRVINVRSTSINYKTMDETNALISGVIGVNGNLKEEILERLLKLEDVKLEGARAIITSPAKVEEYKAFLEANKIKSTEVLSYMDAQGRSLEEVYIDINPTDFTLENGQIQNEAYNKALYTAASRATRLVMASGLNIVNSVDVNLNNLSSGLSEEIIERNDQYIVEAKTNEEFIKGFPQLIEEISPGDIVIPEEKVELSNEAQSPQEQEQIEAEEVESTDGAEGDIINPEEGLYDVAQTEQVEEYEEESYDTGGTTITHKPKTEKGKPKSDALYYPESEGLLPDEDSDGQSIAPIQEGQAVMFAKVERDGKSGIVVLQQAYRTLSNGEADLSRPIQNVYKRVAVLGLDEIDTGLNFLRPSEREQLKVALQSEELGAMLSVHGTKNKSTVEDVDGDISAYNLISGYAIPKGGTQRFKFKYKGQKRVRLELRVQEPSAWMAGNKGLIGRIKDKFLAGAYTNSQAPSNPNQITYDLKIFTKSAKSKLRESYPGLSEAAISIIQPGRPYLVVDNAQVKGGSAKTYVIELRPRPISPKIESDYSMYYKPVLQFIEAAKQFEQIIGHPYGSVEFQDFLVPGKRTEEQMQELITARVQEVGNSNMLPQAMQAREALLMLKFEGRDEQGQLQGSGPAQKAINRLAVSNSMLRVRRKTKNGFKQVARSLFSPLKNTEPADSTANSNRFTIERLENAFNPNDNWNQGGFEQRGLYLPIADFSLYKSTKEIENQVDGQLIDIVESIEPSKIIIERPGKTVTNTTPKRQDKSKTVEENITDDSSVSQQDIDTAGDILDDLTLDYSDNNTGLKGEKISREKALKLLKRLLPDMFDSKGKIIPSVLAMLDFAEMERLTGNKLTLGRFSQGVIFLQEDKTGVYENVVRHEALHKVVWNYLSPAERTALYKAARAKYGMPEGSFSNLEVEERLAEEFMTYRRNPKSFTGAIANFFKKVLKFFGFYQKNVNNIDAFFANVENGYFSGKMYTEADVTGMNFIDIERVFGTVQTYRDASKIFSKFMSNALDSNDKDARVNKDLGIVSRPPLSRDEALTQTSKLVIIRTQKLEQKVDKTADDKRKEAALRKLSDPKILKALFKELYLRDYKSIGMDLEEDASLGDVSLKDVIQRAHDKDHSLSLSEEVIDFLSGLTYSQKGTDTKQRINISHGYYILLQLFAGLDSKLGFNGMQEELIKRSNKLGFAPGTAGHAVSEKLTNSTNGVLVQALTDRLPGRELVPSNARFISDSLFLYSTDKNFDIYGVNYDIDPSVQGVSRIIRQKNEDSTKFFYRVWEAMQQNGQELSSNQLKALYMKESSLKALKNVFVNAANLRKENFKIGEYAMYGDRKNISYYTHRSFGADAVQRGSVKDAMIVNASKLVGNIPSLLAKLSGGKTEEAVLSLLDIVGYDRSLVSLDLRDSAFLQTKMFDMLTGIKEMYGTEENILSDTDFDDKGNPVVVGKSKITMEQILDNERSGISALGEALQFVGQGQKPQTIRTVEGKTLYTYHNSSFGVDSLLSLRPSVAAKNRKEYLKEGSPAYDHTYQYNIFANGDSRVYNISDHDGITSESGFGRPQLYRQEEEGKWSDRIFNYMFLGGMTAIDKKKGLYKYTQQLHTVADAPTLKAAEVRYLNPKDQDNALRNIIKQYKSKPIKKSLVFGSILASKKSDAVKLTLIKAELKKRAKVFENDLKENEISYNTNVMDGFIKSLQDLGQIKAFVGEGEKLDKQKEAARSYVIEQFVANYAINGFFLNQIVLGDEAQFGNSFKVVKRTKIAFAPGHKGFVNEKYGMKKNFRVIVANDPTSSPFDYLTESELSALRDDMQAILGTDFENFDMADAQGYILPERLSDIRKGFGGGIKISTVLKPVYFGIDGNGASNALKYSAVVLSDDLVSRHPKLEQIREAMRAIKADEYVFKTANKVGGPKTLAGNGYTDNKVTLDGQFNEEILFTEDNIVTLDNENYRIQLDPKAGLDKLVSNPTQLAYFIDSNGNNFDAAQEYYQLMADEFGMGLEDFLRSMDSLSSNNRDAIESPTTKRITNMRHKSREFAKKSAAKLASSQKEAEILNTKSTVIEEDAAGNKVEKNKYAIDVNFPGVTNKVFSLLLSKLKASTVKVKFPGYKMVLQSAYGIDVYEEDGISKTKDSIENFEDKLAAGDIKPRQLKHITSDKPYIEVLMPRVHQDRFKLNDIILDDKMMGFRIPSTELHSAVAIKVVGFYDAFETNVLIAPKELTPLHGSDFDVDSLFVLRKASMLDNNKSGKSLYANTERGFEYNGDLILGIEDSINIEDLDTVQDVYDEASKEFSELLIMQREENAKKDTNKEVLKSINEDITEVNKTRDMARTIMSAMRKNRMLDIYIDVIEDKKNRRSMMTPIDMNNYKGVNRKTSDGKKLPSVFDALSDALGVKIQSNHAQLYRDIDLSDPLGERYMHQSNKEGAILTGVFANNMKVLIYGRKGKEGSEDSNVYFGDEENRLSYKIDGTEYSELTINAKGTDITGEIVDEYTYGTLDSSLNASIDNANEQILNIVNLTGNTASMFTIMIGQGVPLNKAAFFINQPAIRLASKALGSRMTAKLDLIEQAIIAKLDVPNDEKLQGRLDNIELNTKDLTDGVKRTDILKDVSAETQLGKSDKELLFQLKVLRLGKELLKYDQPLTDMSKALSVLQELPATIAEFEDIKEALGKIISTNDKGVLEFNSEFKIQIPDIAKNLPHFKAAIEIVKNFDRFTENVLHMASPELKEVASIVGRQFVTDKEAKESSNEKNIKIRTEFIKYIAAGIPEYSTINEPLYTYKNSQYGGTKAFISRLVDTISKLPKSERFNNKFLGNLEVRRQQGRPVGIKFNGAGGLTQADLIELYSDFEKLDAPLKEDLVKYAIVSEGMTFGAGNIGIVINPKYFAKVEKERTALMDKILPRKSASSTQIQKAELMRANMLKHFELQFALNNMGNVKSIFSKKTPDVIKEKPAPKVSSKTISRKVKDGFAYDFKMLDGPKYLRNDYGDLYMNVHTEAAENDTNTTYYQKVGKGNSASSIYYSSEFVMENGYNIGKAFNPTRPVIAVNDINSNKVDISGKYYGLKAGMKIGLVIRGDETRSNLVLADVIKVDPSQSNTISLSLAPERETVTGAASTKENNINSLGVSEGAQC